MKIAISVETAADFSPELLKQYDIAVVPFTIVMGEKSGFDGEITPDDMFAYTAATRLLAKTSAVNEYQYEEQFKKLLVDHDAVIHLAFSSGLSSACANAIEAGKKFPNVYVIDTMTISAGLALLAIYARELVDKGLTPEQIVEAIKVRIPNVQASTIVTDINYLYRGGRLSALAAFGANLLKIRPEIDVGHDGKLHSGKKYRGKLMRVVGEYVENILAVYNNPDLSQAFIAYTTPVQEVITMMRERLEKANFKHINVARVSGTVACHVGPECFGLLYINDGGVAK